MNLSRGTFIVGGVGFRGLADLNTGVAVIHVSWLNPLKEQKLTVIGSEGMAVFDDTKPWADKLRIYRDYLTWKDGQMPTPNKVLGESVTVPELEPLYEECLHFVQRCLDRKLPKTDGAEGLRVLKVLQAAQSSLEKAGAIINPLGLQVNHSRESDEFYAHPSAIVDLGAVIGRGTKIWHFSHIQKGARIGDNCVLGQNVNIDGGVVGNHVKIQNNVSIYSGVTVEDDVFLGPSCVLTNVSNPRSQIIRRGLYERTLIRRGATIGANATILCGVTIGLYAFVAAGTVVTKDVPNYALIKGNPGRQTGWMSRHGHLLKADADGIYHCPESGFKYKLDGPNELRCLDLKEEASLPPGMMFGKAPYSHFK
jgi:UDP-2-acetamido-3-amino-2,3-dideoxy-glucuronate N-acetyltransferase